MYIYIYIYIYIQGTLVYAKFSPLTKTSIPQFSVYMSQKRGMEAYIVSA